MKTTFLKSTIPFAAVAIMGVSGAFLTTSMQSTINAIAPKVGYIDGPHDPCSIPVSCSNNVNVICQANGIQAFGKANNCTEVLYMP